ncbi:MAG: PAS domain-containing protein [Candidatus Falkowbacteria bacterium]
MTENITPRQAKGGLSLKALGSSEAIMVLTNGEFFDCNDATYKLFGYKSREEFLGKHPWDISPPRQADGTDSRLAANLHISEGFRQGERTFNWIHRHADGTDFPALVTLKTVDFEGEPM